MSLLFYFLFSFVFFKWIFFAMPRLSFRIPNPLLYCPHLILHLLVYLFMHAGLLILRVFPFSAVPPVPALVPNTNFVFVS
jgi:hypothetical protein